MSLCLQIRELYGLPAAAADCGAQLLLDLYGAGFVDAYGDSSDQPATALSCLQATFTFVLLDADARCLLAARSAADAPPLYWGSAADGALLFASEADALVSLCDRPTGGAAPFPAGCFYLAADDDRPPQIVGCAAEGNRLALVVFFIQRADLGCCSQLHAPLRAPRGDAGAAHQQLRPGAVPQGVQCCVSCADCRATTALAFAAVLAGLLQPERDGFGQHVGRLHAVPLRRLDDVMPLLLASCPLPARFG